MPTPTHGRRQAEAPTDTPDAQRQCVWWAPAIARASPADAQMRRELARQMDGLMARIDGLSQLTFIVVGTRYHGTFEN